MLFAQKRAQNGIKWTFSIISQNGLKLKVLYFSDILHEVKGTQKLKSDRWYKYHPKRG